MKGVNLAIGRTMMISLSLGMMLFTGTANAADDWEFDIDIYGWVPNLDVETQTGGHTELSRSDIVKNLDFALMTNFRASKGKWFVDSDLIYMDLSDNFNKTLILGTELRKVEVEAWIVVPKIGYRVFEKDNAVVDIYAGLRYLWVEPSLNLRFGPPLPSGRRTASDSGDSWDGIVGFMGLNDLSDNWYFRYQANAGAGDADFTWEAFGALAYKFKKLDAGLGWRYMTWNLDNDAPVKDLTINGPFVGVTLHFR